MCVLVEQCIETMCVSGAKIREEPIGFTCKNMVLESQQLVKACENTVMITRSIAEDLHVSTLSHKVT